ncbi:MAG: type I secretion system permease/ATPase [Campylobacterota bacterium]|nr:type I secretion system permease/ATPase [Campylobacterota bacterium]
MQNSVDKQAQENSELKQAILSSKKSFLLVGFFSLFVNLLMLVPPLYMLQLYDRVLTSRSEGTLYILTAIVVFLFVTMALLEMVRSNIIVKISNRFESILNVRVFDTLFTLANKMPDKASSTPMSDLTQIKQFMTGNGVFAFFDAPWIPIYIAVLFMFHPYFGYFAIFAAVILIIFALINQASSKQQLSEANSLSRNATAYIDANIRNAEVVHALGMKNNIRKVWSGKYYGFLNAQSEASYKVGMWTNISKTSRMLFQSLMLGLGGYLTIQSEVSAGMMIAGSIIMGRALAPLDLMINSWKGFSAAKASYTRLDSLLESFPQNDAYMELPKPKGEVLLENIFVTPPGAEVASLKGISMLIEKGDVVGIIGPSAAGKSSLLKAILGLWPLDQGKSRIDKADINQWDKDILGKYLGYLPQDIELLEGSVSQNIARFNEIDSSKVVEAAKKAGVHEMILRLADGYDTQIGVGGMTLSGGQRQRIGFARAIYDNPVLVVLDEPNSNLDEMGDLALQSAIKTLKEEGTTVIIVTHKPSLLQVTNKLAVMKSGILEIYGNTNDVAATIKAAQKQNELAQSTKVE